MNYGDILTRSWKITWRYRALWLFGLLASCTSQSGGGSGGNFSWQRSVSSNPPPRIMRMMAQIERFSNWLADHPEVILMFVLALFLLTLAYWLLGLLGTAGVISGFRSATEEEQPVITVGSLWQAANHLLGRFFGFSLFSGLLILGSLAVFYGPPFLLLIFGAANKSDGLLLSSVLLLCGSFLIWLFVLLVWHAVYLLARIAIAVEDLGIWDALHRAWQVFREHLGEWVVLALILFVIGLAYGVLLILPFLPSLFTLYRWMNGVDFPLFRIMLFNGLLASPVVFFLNAVYNTFYLGVWTLAYQDVKPAPVALDTAPPSAPVSQEIETTHEDTSDL